MDERNSRRIAIALILVAQYLYHARIFLHQGLFLPSPIEDALASPPCTFIDINRFREKLVCVEKCIPSVNNTLQGLGLNPNDRVSISVPLVGETIEHWKYRVHFPEEGVTLNLTQKLSARIQELVEEKHATGKGSTIRDEGFLHLRPITERLLRRIVAKLLRAGILDPSKSIINSGSWIGDNALPWASMLGTLNPENPGNVIAIDPSELFVKEMVDLAHVNDIGNLCATVGALSSKKGRVASLGSSAEHIEVVPEEDILYKPKYQSRFNAIPIDSLNLPSVSLIHLDVEGYEAEALMGALLTINSSRPVIITEGFDVWPDPKIKNDRRVAFILNYLGYTGNVIPEHCGLKDDARNQIWWPDEQTKEAAMAIIGKDLGRPLVPWIAHELPDI